MELLKVTVGCDPEIFVSKGLAQTSCHNLLPGTKKDPVKVDGGAVQVDGTAAEFNIDPANNIGEFTGNIAKVLTRMQAMMREKEPTAKFTWMPTRKYTKRNWMNIPDSAKEMGCDPDFNAYTGEENPRPHCDIEELRSAGGHIHIGWTKDMNVEDRRHFMDCRMIVAAMDAFLLPFSKSWDKDEQRRLLYGKPGAFRVKPYGVEYRTLSNMWVKSENTQKFVYLAVRSILHHFTKSVDFFLVHDFGELFRKACDGDKESYDKIVNGSLIKEYGKTRSLTHSLLKYAEVYGVSLPEE